MSLDKARRANVVDFAFRLLALFTFVCLWWQSPLVHGNEEMYLAKARGFADPAWLQNSPWVHEWPGARLLFQVLLYPLWEYFTISEVSWYGRFLSSLILCGAITRIFIILRLNLVFSLFVMGVFFQLGQNFFAYEWIWQGFETKVFAYFFILLALGDIMLKKPAARICLLFVLATWFHVLIGGWAFIYYCLSRIIQKVDLAGLAKTIGLYAALVAPLLIYLVYGLQSNPADGQPSADWIYVYFRHPHHLNPLAWPAREIAVAFSAFICSYFLLRNSDNAAAKLLNGYNIAAFIVVLLCCLVPYVASAESFLKLYPYRASTINLLLFLCVVAVALRPLSGIAGVRVFFYAALALSILLNIDRGFRNNQASWQEHDRRQSWAAVLDEVAAITPPAEPIFVGRQLRELTPSIFRLADRDTFVSWKFVPVSGGGIQDWYERVGMQEKFPESLSELQQEYAVKYYLLPESEQLGELQVIWSGYGLVLQVAS